MNENLKSRTIKGLQWSTVSQISRQIVQYVSTFVLVGLLSPSDFGLMAMALIVIGFLDIFKDLGTGSALIQNENPSDRLKSSLFWINAGFGLIITLLLYSTAPIVANIYGSKDVAQILQVLSISFFIAGISIVHKSLLEKSLSFKTLSIIESISSVVSSTVGITLAFWGYGVWSLVFQTLTFSFLNSLFLWMFSKWHPVITFNYKELKALSSYSLNLLGFNIINYFSRNADYFIIGKFLGDRPLGHYYLAYRIMLYPVQNITTVVSRVIFPSFSTVQTDNNKLKNAYSKVTNSIAILTFPMMMGLAFLSNDFVKLFFGSNWNSELVSRLIIILSPVGALQSIVATVGIIYQAKGRTDWMFKWSIFAIGITILGFFIGLRWGVIGVAVSYLITNLLLLYPVFSIPFNLIDLSPFTFFRSFTNTLISTFTMLITLFIISLLIINVNPMFKVAVLLISGVITYFIISLKINKEHFSDLKLFLPNLIKSGNNK